MAIAVVAVGVAIRVPGRRRTALVVAGVLFLVAGVLGILSIGIVFIGLAAACGVAAARDAGAPSDPSSGSP